MHAVTHSGLDIKPFILVWFFPLWLAALACGVGVLVFWGLPWASIVFFPLAYTALCFALLTTARSWHDWINPLSLILVIGFVRFTIPGVLVLFTDPDIPIFYMMDLHREDWVRGHILAVIGLLSTTIGWCLVDNADNTIFHHICTKLKVDLSHGVLYTAILGMMLGSIAWFVFAQSHMSVPEAVVTGGLRQIPVESGTGKYFVLSFLLIASSVVFSDYLFHRKYVWWIALLPVIVAMLPFFVLGGRTRSLTPIAAALLVFRSHRGHLQISPGVILGFGSFVSLIFIVYYCGQAYRGGLGGEAFSQIFSLSGILAYGQYTVWLDFGQLHALAGAVAIGAGVLGGATFGVLLWPLTKMFALPGKSAGVFIVQSLVGFGEQKWGFHPTLIGDAYLNFGLLGVMVITIMFGMILKIIYLEFGGRGRCNALYALATISSVRLFFESIDKYEEVMVVLIFVFVIIKTGQVFSQIAELPPWGRNTKY